MAIHTHLSLFRRISCLQCPIFCEHTIRMLQHFVTILVNWSVINREHAHSIVLGQKTEAFIYFSIYIKNRIIFIFPPFFYHLFSLFSHHNIVSVSQALIITQIPVFIWLISVVIHRNYYFLLYELINPGHILYRSIYLLLSHFIQYTYVSFHSIYLRLISFNIL